MHTTTGVNMISLFRSARRFIGAVAASGSMALAVGSPAHALNLVTNGSFETGNFSGWTQFGDTSFSGVQCLVVAPDGQCEAFFGVLGATGGIQQNLATVAGQSYLISFALSPDGGTPSSFAASFGGTTLLSLINPPASAFQTYSFLTTATSANTLLSFSFRDDPGFLLFDAVSVTVPEPASIALVAAALAVVLVLRRRRVR